VLARGRNQRGELFPKEIGRSLKLGDVNFSVSLISPRFDRRESVFTRRLLDKQKEAIAEVILLMSSGEWGFEAVPCPCGGREFRALSMQDRFSIPSPISACRICGLLQTNPRLNPSSYEDFYKRFYRRIYMAWEPEFLFQNQRQRGSALMRWIRDHGISVQPGQRVCEIGAGAGGILSVFADIGCEVSGCDFDSRFLAYGKQKGLDLREGDSSQLFSSRPADLMILCHVVEHISDPVAELKRIRHLLSPDGILCVQVPCLDFELLRYHPGGHIQFDFLDYSQNAHTYHFERPNILWIVGLAGFEEIAYDENTTALFRMMTQDKVPLNSSPPSWCPTIGGDPSLFQLDKLRRMEARRRSFLQRVKQPSRALVATFRSFLVAALGKLGLIPFLKKLLRPE